jgi:hypothetical protein
MGTPKEKAQAGQEGSVRACHPHIPWEVAGGPLAERMNNPRNAGYQGYYSGEHHSGRDEYARAAAHLAKVRAVLENRRTGATGELVGGGAPRAAPARGLVQPSR